MSQPWTFDESWLRGKPETLGSNQADPPEVSPSEHEARSAPQFKARKNPLHQGQASLVGINVVHEGGDIGAMG